jgi:cell division protein FtsL
MLQSKIEQLSGVDKILALETKLKDSLKEKSDLEKKVKDLEK